MRGLTKKALPIAILVLILSISATAMAEEIIPDGNTVLLDHLNGTTLGTAFGPLTYVDSLPNLDRAGDFVEGTYVRYDLHAWYSSGWGWGSADARGTVEAWIKPRTYGKILWFQWFKIYELPTWGTIGILSLDADGKLFWDVWNGEGGWDSILGATTIPLDEWTHVAVTWGSTVTKLYINGIVDASIERNIYPAMGWYGAPYVYVYLNSWGGIDFGYIDELHISKVQRTDEEIWLHYSQAIVVHATIDIDPDTLNLKSKGRWMTCHIELPEGYDVEDIDASTVRLCEGGNLIAGAELHPTKIGDYDDDGIPDLMVKFDRQALIDYLKGQGYGDGELTVTGEVAGTPFEGFDTIRVK